MTNLEKIIETITTKVREKIEDAIEFDYRDYMVEEIYGKAWIQVEGGVQCVNGWLLPYADVTIFHEDNSHESPRLEQAIKEALPKWEDVERSLNDFNL